MKKLLFTLIVIIVAASTVKAEGWTPETLPMVHLQDSTRYVCNPDGVLSEAAVDSLDFMLRRLKNAKGIETVLVVVKHIEGDDPYEFCMQLGNSYGVGDKEKRTGLIVLLSTEDRSYQILTGRGLEGTLPDVECYNIEQEHMIPSLKEGDWDKAMIHTIMAISAVVLEDPSLTPKQDEGDPWLGLGIVGLIGGGIYGLRRLTKRKCPNCGKRKLKCTYYETTLLDDSYRHYKATYTCKACGHTFTENGKTPRGNRSGAAAAGAAGASYIRHSSGGGFGGGSFGGGSFGGGGAGGRF